VSLGARYDPERGGTRFLVWAPKAEEVTLELLASEAVPEPRQVRMEPALDEHPGGEPGYFRAFVPGLEPGARYGSTSSRHHVHGSDVFTAGSDVFYGSTSAPSTFAVVPHLDRLRDLGVTALELMPVAQFPGERNWGYDGVCPSRPSLLRGPVGLAGWSTPATPGPRGGARRRLQPPGPGGQLPPRVRPLLHRPLPHPLGEALNFDGPDSDEVRRFFLENALWWLADVGVDALRLDAVHAIADESAIPFLEELGGRSDELAERHRAGSTLIAESDPTPCAVLRPRGQGGERPRRPVERRLPPRAPHLLTGRARRLLPGLRRRSALGRAMERGLRLHRPVLPLPEPPPRRGRRPASPRRASSSAPRTTTRWATGCTGSGSPRSCRRGAQARRGRRAAPVALRAAAVHGGGVRRDGAVPLLRPPRRPGAGRGGAAGPQAGVRALPHRGRRADARSAIARRLRPVAPGLAAPGGGGGAAGLRLHPRPLLPAAAREPVAGGDRARTRPTRTTTGTSASPPSATRPTPPRASSTATAASSTSSTTTRASASTSARRCCLDGERARRLRRRSSRPTARAASASAATARRSPRPTTT
jgi:hypothetical protein